MNHSQPLLTTEEAARLLKLPKRTLEDWRVCGGGPQYIKLGRQFDIQLRQSKNLLLGTPALTQARRRDDNEWSDIPRTLSSEGRC